MCMENYFFEHLKRQIIIFTAVAKLKTYYGEINAVMINRKKGKICVNVFKDFLLNH